MSDCTRAQRVRLDLELGLAEAERRAALAEHLAACPGCAAWATGERELTMALRSLRGIAPPTADVARAVARRIAELPAAGERETSAREVGFWAAAAAAWGAGLLTGLWRLGPDLRPLVPATRDAVGALATTAEGLAAPLAGAVAGLAKLAGRLLALLGTFSGTLDTLQDAALAMVVLGACAMVATIAAVLGRDILHPRWIGGGHPR